MAKCLICDAQKGKRHCFLKEGFVCSLCCGTTRTSDACAGCPHYQDPKLTRSVDQVPAVIQGSGYAPRNALSSQNQEIQLSDRHTGKPANHEQKQLMVTTTGEIYQPVRLYYKIFNKSAIERKFRALRCMDIDREKDRWVWLYIEEAKKISFPYPYNQIPIARHPIVIGSFFTKVDDEMYLDVRSIERAVEAILFFDKHLDRSFAKVTHAAVLNRLPFDNLQSPRFNFDEFFDNEDVVEVNPEQMIDDLREMTPESADINERRANAFAVIMQKMSEEFPNAEKFSVHYYEDGIDQFKSSLMLRQKVALERWQGKENVTGGDMFEKMFGKLLP